MRKILFSLGAFLVIAASILAVFVYSSRKPLKSPVGSKSTVADKVEISAIVVPHYDFAKDKRQELLKDAAQKVQPKEIILASVNHFKSGQSDITTTTEGWDFANVNPLADKALAEVLIGTGLAQNDHNAFFDEHGIKNVLPDVAAVFPKAQILPLIIDDTTAKEKIDSLEKSLEQNCPNCLLVSSIDFSHYCPNSLAQIHDEMSLTALENKDLSRAWSAETDSPQNMYLTVKWAQRFATHKFNLFYHDNSSNSQNNDELETTSYILGDYTNGSTPKTHKKTSTFLIAGDAMFDRLVNHRFLADQQIHIFDNFGVRPFWGVDMPMLNLEGPISATPINDDVSADNLVFDFPPGTAKTLKSIHVSAVSLANNHTLNAGASGLLDTKKALEEAGISYDGDPNSFSDNSIKRFDGEIPISAIAVNALSSFSQDKLLEAIKSEKAAGNFVLVFPHWGNEYQAKHNLVQENLAKGWIDAGADLVVGSHPHVVEDMQTYRGKAIIYSLGNFVFDQTFSSETQAGLALAGKITDSNLQLSFFPIQIKNLQPQFMRGQMRLDMLHNLFGANTGIEPIRSDTINLTRL